MQFSGKKCKLVIMNKTALLGDTKLVKTVILRSYYLLTEVFISLIALPTYKCWHVVQIFSQIATSLIFKVNFE